MEETKKLKGGGPGQFRGGGRVLGTVGGGGGAGNMGEKNKTGVTTGPKLHWSRGGKGRTRGRRKNRRPGQRVYMGGKMKTQVEGDRKGGKRLPKHPPAQTGKRTNNKGEKLLGQKEV